MKTTYLFILTFMFLQRSNAMMNSSNIACVERERQSLLKLKNSLIDETNRLATWTGVECCKWVGVGCDRRNGHVVKLDLRSPVSLTGEIDKLYTGNSLRGKLSPSLTNLKYLHYLDLSMNNFSGDIPEFMGSFKRLKYLNLSHSGFGGVVPHHLGNLSRLQYLDLNDYYDKGIQYLDLDNSYQQRLQPRFLESFLIMDDLQWLSSLSLLKHLDLSGITAMNDHIDWFHPVNMLPSLLTLNMASCHIKSIPSVVFVNFTSLKSLDLSVNLINSTIPFWLSNLTGLMHINLQSNYFHGRIPEFLGTLNALASIDLSKNSFNTQMPDLFWNLSSLVRLDLSSNMFHGSFLPDVNVVTFSDSLLNSLKYLNLEKNIINGSLPNKLGDFKNLEYLLLSQNSFSGPLPPSLGSISSLKELDISINRLNGSIPESFGLLSRLERLEFWYNQLSGSIPMSLGQLSNLKKVDISYNSLSGIVSETHFIGLKKLTFLQFSSNSLELNVSSGWIPPFQLQRFSASSCNVGPHFPTWLKTQTNLQFLDLSYSSLVGTIPKWFQDILPHIYYLDLSHNQIEGTLPPFHGSIPESQLMMNSNKFEGSLTSFPSNVQLLDLSDNCLSGNVPQTDGTLNPGLIGVNLSKNNFTGSLPIHLCKVLSLIVLDLSQNKFSGRLPDCLGNLISLQAIDITNNMISGVVPSSLEYLKNLRTLNLHNNRFEGDLPLFLQNLTSLVTMDLGNNLFKGPIPFWIGEKLSNLRILNLQSNKFKGKIPQQLCRLENLQLLSLAQNKITGTIPHCFGNISGMITNQVGPGSEYVVYPGESIWASVKGSQLLYTKTIRFLISLDLSSNNIVGEIPDALMNLVRLNNLNLSRNLLTGQIPVTIGDFKQLESLDLSTNKLSGRIPQSLATLNFLSYLNLSFNNLSGAIPIGNQMQTLDDTSIYEGNNGLCGPPLPRSCKGNDSSYNHDGKEEGQDDNEDLWFFVGMGPGFVVGFIGLLGSLHFIRMWRVAYFEFLDNIYGWVMQSVLLNLVRLRRTSFY